MPILPRSSFHYRFIFSTIGRCYFFRMTVQLDVALFQFRHALHIVMPYWPLPIFAPHMIFYHFLLRQILPFSYSGSISAISFYGAQHFSFQIAFDRAIDIDRWAPVIITLAFRHLFIDAAAFDWYFITLSIFFAAAAFMLPRQDQRYQAAAFLRHCHWIYVIYFQAGSLTTGLPFILLFTSRAISLFSISSPRLAGRYALYTTSIYIKIYFAMPIYYWLRYGWRHIHKVLLNALITAAGDASHNISERPIVAATVPPQSIEFIFRCCHLSILSAHFLAGDFRIRLLVLAALFFFIGIVDAPGLAACMVFDMIFEWALVRRFSPIIIAKKFLHHHFISLLPPLLPPNYNAMPCLFMQEFIHHNIAALGSSFMPSFSEIPLYTPRYT